MTDEAIAVLRGIEAQLTRLADAAEVLVAPPQADPSAPAPTCEHPAEARIDFGMTDGVEDWQCGVCLYRTVTP